MQRRRVKKILATLVIIAPDARGINRSNFDLLSTLAVAGKIADEVLCLAQRNQTTHSERPAQVSG